jgi:hypothetical protein
MQSGESRVHCFSCTWNPEVDFMIKEDTSWSTLSYTERTSLKHVVLILEIFLLCEEQELCAGVKMLVLLV